MAMAKVSRDKVLCIYPLIIGAPYCTVANIVTEERII